MTNGNKEKVNLYLLMPVFSVQIKLKVGGQIEIIFDLHNLISSDLHTCHANLMIRLLLQFCSSLIVRSSLSLILRRTLNQT